MSFPSPCELKYEPNCFAILFVFLIRGGVGKLIPTSNYTDSLSIALSISTLLRIKIKSERSDLIDRSSRLQNFKWVSARGQCGHYACQKGGRFLHRQL